MQYTENDPYYLEWNNLKGDEIMGYTWNALGDSFAMFSHTILMGKFFNKPMKLTGRDKKLKNFKQFIELVKEPQFVEFTSEKETVFKKLYCTMKHLKPYCELKYTWKNTNTNKICYHYDTMTKSKRTSRFPNQDEEKWFLSLMKDIDAINVGYPMPFKQVCEISENCKFFVGIESGISHIMHALNIPTYIRNWGNGILIPDKVTQYHPNKNFILIKDFYSIEQYL